MQDQTEDLILQTQICKNFFQTYHIFYHASPRIFLYYFFQIPQYYHETSVLISRFNTKLGMQHTGKEGRGGVGRSFKGLNQKKD